MEKVGFNDLSWPIKLVNSLTLNLKSNLVPLLTLALFLILKTYFLIYCIFLLLDDRKWNEYAFNYQL